MYLVKFTMQWASLRTWAANMNTPYLFFPLALSRLYRIMPFDRTFPDLHFCYLIYNKYGIEDKRTTLYNVYL